MSKKINFLKLTYLSKLLLTLLLILSGIGFVMQYSAGAGDVNVYAYSYLVKAIIAFVILFLTIKLPLKIIFLLTDIFYYFTLLLLLLVDIIGITRLGAQRWLDLGLFVVQPSELMKIAIILVLAKYFHTFSISQISKVRFYIQPFLLTIVPFILITLQPDLGTAIIVLAIASALFFLAGFNTKYFIAIGGVIALISPIIWLLLHNYQKERILTFLNPDRDPLGAGYHITQSKIAIGSGGFTGKGFLSGTQSQLNFLPEKHTDFVFTLLSEEFGFLGSLLVIILYVAIIIVLIAMSHRCYHSFGKYVIAGVLTMFFIYVFVNIGMVSGILPVVGIPLPLLSFGGTALLTNMIGFGLVLNIENNKEYYS